MWKEFGTQTSLSESVFRNGNSSPNTEVILPFLIVGNVGYVKNISINLITI